MCIDSPTPDPPPNHFSVYRLRAVTVGALDYPLPCRGAVGAVGHGGLLRQIADVR